MRFNSLQLTNQFVRGVYLSTFENRSWLLLVVLNNLLRMFELSILIPLFCFFWQIFLCLIFLFPIRLLLGILLFIFAGIWCFFTTVGWNPQDLKTPLTPWRRYLQLIVNSQDHLVVHLTVYHAIIIMLDWRIWY